MTTDIVERLRNPNKDEIGVLLEDAAYEIDRLKKSLHELAFRALDTVSESTPYRFRKKYVKDAKREIALDQNRDERRKKSNEYDRERKKKEKEKLSDYYIKTLITKHGVISFKDVTPELIQLKRDQIISKRVSLQLAIASKHQKEN